MDTDNMFEKMMTVLRDVVTQHDEEILVNPSAFERAINQLNRGDGSKLINRLLVTAADINAFGRIKGARSGGGNFRAKVSNVSQNLRTELIDDCGLADKNAILTMRVLASYFRRPYITKPAIGGFVHDFGQLPKKDLNWHIIDVRDNEGLLISDEIIQLNPLNNPVEFIVGSNNRSMLTTWLSCTLRDSLNHIFIKAAFNLEELNIILETKIPSEKDDGRFSIDKLFLLSKEEILNLWGENRELEVKRSGGVDLKNCWWTRSTNGILAYCVYGDDMFDKRKNVTFYEVDATTREVGVRLSMWIKLY